MEKDVSGMLRGIVVKVCLAVGSFVILFGVLELGFRIVEALGNRTHSVAESWAIYDEDLLYRPRPNYGDFNSDGLRDNPIDTVKTKFRILMLFDSFLWRQCR